ncbi:MAG: MBL fold metallo-hydrolase [Actinomycetota bacterium]
MTGGVPPVEIRIERVLAPNPGPFTSSGTNTWLLDSRREVLIIDPGPVIASHRDQIFASVGSRRAVGVLVTHTHPDHAPLANPVAAELGVPAYGYAAGPDFKPDVAIGEGDSVRFGSEQLRVLYTPGHSEDHLCFLAGRLLFSGDHIMGGGSSVMVENLNDYLQSLGKLRRLDLDRVFPGHGEEVEEPQAIIDWYLAHRLQREREIIEAIKAGAGDVREIVAIVYREVARALHPLAAQTVIAHLNKLEEEGRLIHEGQRVGWVGP